EAPGVERGAPFGSVRLVRAPAVVVSVMTDCVMMVVELERGTVPIGAPGALVLHGEARVRPVVAAHDGVGRAYPLTRYEVIRDFSSGVRARVLVGAVGYDPIAAHGCSPIV